jgi:4-carboxymuconolactone decarboxylase
VSRPVRIAGQAPHEWSEATRAELGGVVATSGNRRLHLPSVVAHHPTFLGPDLTWAKAVALGGVLSARDHALLALRTAWRCGSEFEWGVHAETALTRAGLSADEVAAVAAGPVDGRWSAGDAALLQAVDDLHDAHAIADATWTTLAAEHDAAALLEIAFVVGHYTMLSMVANSAGVPPEPHWAALGRAPAPA